MSKPTKKRDKTALKTAGDLFPEAFRELLSVSGRQFIERAGKELVREATLQVLLGHNVRTQTEPLTRQRIAEVGGAIIALFERGARESPEFFERMSRTAIDQLLNGSNKREQVWPSQWSIGLTGKGVQNVLRGEQGDADAYLSSFETAISQASKNLRERLGELRLSIGIGSEHEHRALTWTEALRLTTMLGCAELAIRGSEKSRYGKLFERLVLGSVLEMLGFTQTEPHSSKGRERVFWLSDSSDERECDATAIVRPGVVARFDIGFIGIGNPEIIRDKLSRFARQFEMHGRSAGSTTFVIVDRYPTGPRASSREMAERSGTALVQMSMSMWPRELARELRDRLGHEHPIATMSDAEVERRLRAGMRKIDLLGFLPEIEQPDEESE